MALTRADLTTREREIIERCFHEAGHAVAGVVLGGVLSRAVVSGGLRGGTICAHATFEDLPPGEPEIALAGPWAQARWRHDRTPRLRELYAVLDGAGRVDRNLISAAGGPAAAAGIVPVLQRCWPSIVTVAAQLWRTTDARHGDICAALGIPAADNSHELSLIRSGCAPGSFTITTPAA